MLSEETRLPRTRPQLIIVVFRGLGSRLPDADWYPDAAVVVFGCRIGYGATGTMPDDDDGTPRSLHPQLEGLTAFLERHGPGLEELGLLPRRGQEAPSPRIILPAAHFRPGNPHWVAAVVARLQELWVWADELGLRERLWIFAESAGTHSLGAVAPLLFGTGFRPSRVIVSAWAMSPDMLLSLLPLIDGWVFLAHSGDLHCPQAPAQDPAWELL